MKSKNIFKHKYKPTFCSKNQSEDDIFQIS